MNIQDSVLGKSRMSTHNHLTISAKHFWCLWAKCCRIQIQNFVVHSEFKSEAHCATDDKILIQGKEVQALPPTFPLLCRIVVLVLHTLSLLTMSLVTSTSASTKLLCWAMSSSKSVLIVDRFFAIIFALMAAIFSTDIVSDRDLKTQERPVKKCWDIRKKTHNCQNLSVPRP